MNVKLKMLVLFKIYVYINVFFAIFFNSPNFV